VHHFNCTTAKPKVNGQNEPCLAQETTALAGVTT